MRNRTRKYLFYFVGIIILTLGIALTIQSKLGTSPFDALLVGLFRTVGLSIGSWEIVVGGSLVLINAIAERRRPEYLALLTSLITGIGIDFWVVLLRGWLNPAEWIGQTLCLVLGIILSGLGVATYLQSNYAPNPMDRTMLVIQDLTGFNVTISRAIISIVLVIIAFFFNGPIGIGTLAITFLSGAVIHFFIPYLAKVEKGITLEPQSVS